MNSIGKFLKKLSMLLGRKRFDRELDEEMAFHREQAERELIAGGMTADAARYGAMRRFGNATRLKEKSHEVVGFSFEAVAQDIRLALRQLRKNPAFAATVVITLALGIGATTSIFTLVNATLLRSLPYAEADRIVKITDVRMHGRSTGGLVGVPRFYDLVARSQSFDELAYFYYDQPAMIVGSQLPVSMEASGVSSGFWRVFGVQPLLGRTFDEKDMQPNAPQVVVLSYRAWKQVFGRDKGAIGQTVKLDKKKATIVGVMPQSFQKPGATELWLPSDFTAGTFGNWRGEGSRFINVYGRVKSDTPISSVESDLRRVGEQLRRQYPEADGEWQFASVRLRDELYGELRPALIVLQIASCLLLVIACINVANLLMSRATARRSEVALRSALGASNKRIATQSLVESLLLALGGGALGLVTAFTLVRTLAARLPGTLGADGALALDWSVVGFAVVVSVATGIGFGLAPVWQSRRVELSTTLKRGEGRLAGAGSGVRNVFVAVQIGISLVLLVGASLLTESLWKLMKSPMGFEPDHVLTFEIKLPWNESAAAVNEFYSEVQRRLENLPGVAAVGQIDALPTADWHVRTNFDAEWLPRVANHPAINAEDRHIAGDYLRAIGASLLEGRSLTAQDAETKITPVLVNQQLALRYHPQGSPVGLHLMMGTNTYEIVGVLHDVRGTAGSMAQAAGPEVYLPAGGNQGVVRRSFIVRSHVRSQQLTRAIQEQVHAVDSQQAMRDVSTMNDLISESVAQPRLNMFLLGSFAAVALLLASLGTYSVVAFAAAQRKREVGVRMALGASRAQISFLFIGRALHWACIGIASGVVAALLLSHLLRSQLYQVQPNDPRIYLASILVLLVPMLAATLRPSLRAAQLNPAEVLRAE